MGQFDAVFSNEASRRTFLKGVGVLGASGVFAACRKNVDSERAGGTSSASLGPIEQEPGTLKAYEWAGYDTKWLFSGLHRGRLSRPEVQFLRQHRRRDGQDRGAATTGTSRHPENGYIQDYVNHGRDPAVGHLADPELRRR